MSLIRLTILLLVLFSYNNCIGQNTPSKEIPDTNSYNNRPSNINNRSLEMGDSVFIILGNCKSITLVLFQKTLPVKSPAIEKQPVQVIPKRKIPFLTLHGNILYNYSYRSYIDTPYAQKDVMQHLVQTSLNIVIKEKYPVKITLRNRSSNSPYFVNGTDINLEFNRNALLNNIKADLKTKANSLVSMEALNNAENLFNSRKVQVQKLQAWINSPARAQEFVEEKENRIRAQKGNIQSKSVNEIATEIADTDQNELVEFDIFSKSRQFNKFKKINKANIISGVKDTAVAMLSADNKPMTDSASINEKRHRTEYGKNIFTVISDVTKGKGVNTSGLKQIIKDSLQSKLNAQISEIKDSSELGKAYLKYSDSLKSILNGKELSGKIKDSAIDLLGNHKPVLKDSSLLEKYNHKKYQLDSLQNLVKKEEANLTQAKRKAQDSVNKIKSNINGLNTTSGLFAFMKQNGIGLNQLTRAQRILLSINQIGIGRNWIDYSELTVKNISLSGVNIEMNPLPFYFAFAAGKVNYRFRDFIIKDNKQLPDQSLYLIRAGIGQKEKNNLILTFYNGKKSVLNYTSSNGPASVQRVLGFSAESRIAINQNNYIIAEIAKSSYYDNSTVQPTSSDLVGKAVNLRTNTNLAYSIKLYSQNPGTNTRITGYFKKIGEDFQSYNLYPMNINQEAWMIRVNQKLFKKKLDLDAAVRKNDFNSPIAAPSFSTKTIFKSLQATLRIPKYPFISVGYYPSSQLSLQSNNLLVENQYNTLNAIMGYSYRVKRTSMSSNATYTKFFNNSSDTSFIYFNAKSWTFNHSIFLSRFSLESSAGLMNQKDIKLMTLEQLISYRFRTHLSLTGGVKWNRLNNSETMYGGTVAMNIYIKKLGTIQLNYDKSFLPGANRNLVPVDIGRMSFLREF